MKERTIAMFWALGVFVLIMVSSFLNLEQTVIAAIAGLAGVIIGYYFARDANGSSNSSP